MLCNSVRRLAPRVAECREKIASTAQTKLAVEVSVSRMHSGAVTAVGAAGEGRWGPAASQERGCRRWASTEVAPGAGLTLDVDERISRVKHRIPQKRASLLLSELRAEQCSGEKGVWPDMKIGDAIEVTMYANKKAARTTQVRGVLVRKVTRGVDSTILLRDVINGNSVESHIPLFSPLIESIEVMETAFIYQGKLKGKRVRPARIYYIRDLDQKYYRITGGGGSEN